MAWARCGSFQSDESSARALSSVSLALARSQSKMPPQQAHRLLDLIGDRLEFRPHFSPTANLRGRTGS
jgi:hypothetical protein